MQELKILRGLQIDLSHNLSMRILINCQREL